VLLSKKYRHDKRYRSPARRRLAMLVIAALIVLLIATIGVRRFYFDNLQPVNTNTALVTVDVPTGANTDAIADLLVERNLIRSKWAFRLYVHNQSAGNVLQAGRYSLSSSMSVNQIVANISRGKVMTDLVTILPGQTLAQIKQTLTSAGYSEADINAALDPTRYGDVPVLVDKPASASLEGFLYPDSFQKDSATSPETLVRASMTELQQRLTPELRQKFANQNLSTYQALVLASIIEREVSHEGDRPQVAQVFLKRLQDGMTLGSDVTAFYGADLYGLPRNVRADTPFNTRLYRGLPPTPIATVSQSSLNAVANPSNTDWVYFVSGDDGTTYFSKTLAEHQALVNQYCDKLCQ